MVWLLQGKIYPLGAMRKESSNDIYRLPCLISQSVTVLKSY